MADPAPTRSPRSHAVGSGRRERFRWLMFAGVLFLLSTAALIHWGLGVLWGRVPNRSDTISTDDHGFAAKLKDRLLAERIVALPELTDFPWDTVCLIEPFDLDQASLQEALLHGHLPQVPIDLPNGPQEIAQPNWLFAFLQDHRVVRTVEFQHREIEPRHGAYCVAHDQARFAGVKDLGAAVSIDLAKKS